MTKTPIKNLIRPMPKPIGYDCTFDWLSLKTRPTTDLANLFNHAGVPVKDIEPNEKLKTVQAGYKDGGFKAKISEPIVNPETGEIKFNGLVDVLMKHEKRQLKFSKMALEPKKYGLKAEDLEIGQVTSDSDFGDSVITDAKRGYYSVGAREFRRSNKYPIKQLQDFAKIDLRDYPDFDTDKEFDIDYIYDFIRHIPDTEDPYYSSFLVIPGGLTSYVDIRDLAKKFKDDATATRVDIAFDLVYQTPKQVSTMLKLFETLGGLRGTLSNPEKHKYMTAGDWNKKHPITKVTTTKGNVEDNADIGEPETIYFGARSGRIMLRVYNKGADVYQKHGIKIPPTLRLEIECKESLARAIYDQLQKGADPLVLFKTVINHFITFDHKTIFEVTKTDFMKIDKVDLELSEHETKQVSTQYFLERQFAKSVHKILDGVPDVNKILYVLKCLGATDFLPDDKKEYDKVMNQLFDLIQSGKGERFIDAINADEREKKKK